MGEIVDRANQYWYRVRDEYERAFRSLGLQAIFVEVTASDAIPSAMAEIGRRKAETLIVRGDPMLKSNAEQIAGLALQYALPTIAEDRRMPAAGQLLSYGPDDLQRVAAVLTFDRILRGAKPVDIPIEQPTKFELVISFKTAKALGFTIPPSLLARAEVIP